MKIIKLALLPLALATSRGRRSLNSRPAANQPPPQPMSFFVTSVGKGDGANLGGAGRRGCALPDARGRGWTRQCDVARLHERAARKARMACVHARDRIGRGPWFNAKGALIASNVDDLHQDRNNIRKPTALNEKGEEVNGAGQHAEHARHADGLGLDGPARAGQRRADDLQQLDEQRAGNAMLGHHDRLGGPNASWNAVHSSRSCSQEDLVATGGAGLFYCFVAQ